MRLKPNFRLERVAGEYMLLDTAAGLTGQSRVLGLNEPAAWLWRRIGSMDFDEHMLVGWILDEYDVSAEVAESDVHSMVSLWGSLGLLQ